MILTVFFALVVVQVSSTHLGNRGICDKYSSAQQWYAEVGDGGRLIINNSRTISSTAGHCFIKLTTCNECHFEIDFNYATPFPMDDKYRRTDFVRFQEGDSTHRKFYSQFGENNTYEFVSEANEVTVDLFYTELDDVTFVVDFEAVQNLYFITESSEGNNTGYIQSPYFPNSYPLHYSAEYFFSNSMPFGRVLLLFLDWGVFNPSRLEVIDTNGSSMGVYSDETFRPPALLSSGSALGVKFSANTKAASGFRTQFTFRHASAGNYKAPEVPNTKCGGLLANFGGTITMQNVVNDDHTKPYDCIWIIKPTTLANSVTHLSLKLLEFLSTANGSKLEIRKGIYSTSPLLQLVTSENYPYFLQTMWTVSTATEGFYIRFEGFLNKNSTMALTYAAFDYWTCFGAMGSLCNNHHCIHRSLFCDGFDHCGDGSDEQPALCYVTGLSAVQNTWWHTKTPNYILTAGYPPRSVDLPLLACGLALIVMLSTIGLALCWIFKRMSKRRRVGSSRPVSPSDSSEIFSLQPTTSDSPPKYDPPPSYEDIAKTFFHNLQLQAEAVTSTESADEAGTSSSTRANETH